MKLLILFLIFLLLFTPTVIADKDNYTLQLMFEDLSGEIVYELDNLSGNFINERGIALNFTISNHYKSDCTINRTFISDVPIPLGNYNSTIYQSRLFKGGPENLLPIITIISESEIRFQDETKIYPISLDELDGKPSKFVMYDMSNESYNLAKQSEKTSERSLILSLFALLFTIVSLRITFCHKGTLISNVQNKRQVFNRRCNNLKNTVWIRRILLGLISLGFIIMAIMLFDPDKFGIWALDRIIDLLMLFLFAFCTKSKMS